MNNRTFIPTDTAFEMLLGSAIDAYSDGELNLAISICDALQSLHPTDARAFKIAASAYLMKERHHDAERIYEQAHNLDPSDPYTLVALGELKLRTLQLGDVATYFEPLFESDPDCQNPAANRGRRVLLDFYERLKK